MRRARARARGRRRAEDRGRAARLQIAMSGSRTAWSKTRLPQTRTVQHHIKFHLDLSL